jgi:hypothetical protein
MERVPSASSNRGGTRQRLQYPSTRQVNAIENTNDTSALDIKRNSLISTISLIDKKSTIDDNKDLPLTIPLKNLTFKKFHSNPVAVSLSFFEISNYLSI